MLCLQRDEIEKFKEEEDVDPAEERKLDRLEEPRAKEQNENLVEIERQRGTPRRHRLEHPTRARPSLADNADAACPRRHVSRLRQMHSAQALRQ